MTPEDARQMAYTLRYLFERAEIPTAVYIAAATVFLGILWIATHKP